MLMIDLTARRLWDACHEALSAFLLAVAVLALIVLLNPVSVPTDEDRQLDKELFEFDEAPSETTVPDLAAKPPAISEEDAVPQPPPWLEYRIRRGDTMARILKTIGADRTAQDYLLAQKLKSYRKLRRGDHLQFRLDDERQLAALRYKTSRDYYLHAGRDENGVWWANEAPPVLTTVVRKAGGQIESSLFAAADRAGFSNRAIDLLISALETQVDFHRDTRKGDSFRAIYTEALDEDGEALGAGQLLAFEYTSLLNPKKPHRLRGMAWNGKNSGYYSQAGQSLQGAFLRAPLKFRRISSKFTRRRYHPVLKKWRAHRGVDYAAATGTPVRATADGVVSKIARERGYGNVVLIKHYNVYTTVYGHLRRFAKNMRRGRKVRQGQVIGYVGQTGLATGPHLHYEFRIRGKHKDPLSQSVPKVLPPLKGQELKSFQAHAAPLAAQLHEIAIP